MDRPITENEIKLALTSSEAGKSPGPDGFTVLYYKKYKEILLPKLCQYFNGLGREYKLSKEASEATITVIPKEGKDIGSCSGYRPISLLNTDIKSYAKVLAGRVRQEMTKLVHPDQTGFVQGRERVETIE